MGILYRITRNEKGYIVEVKKRKKWEPFITYSGIDDPYPFSEAKSAEKHFLKEVKWNLYLNTDPGIFNQ